MNFKNIFPLFFTFIFSLFILSACGYKPTISYASKALEGKVYVDVDINIDNARNSVLMKDALIDLITNKFKLQIASNKLSAKSFIKAKLISVNHTELLSDTSGFAKVYRETVSIEFKYKKLNSDEKTLSLNDYYDFSVEDDSAVTQAKKDEAISIAISKALINIFSKIAVQTQY